VRALAVVVKDKLPEHPVEMAFAADKHPSRGTRPSRCGRSVRRRRSLVATEQGP
jgi:hypothetical protein